MAGATFSRIKTWVAEILTYSDLNAEFDNILNNLTPAGIDDESASDAAARATADPYPAGSLSKATSLQGEVQQLRYLINQLNGMTYWYQDPVEEIWIPAGAMIPATTNGAAAGSLETSTNKILFDYFAFDTTTEEFVGFNLVMPNTWNLGTVKAKFFWAPATDSGEVGNTVEWEIGAIAMSNGDNYGTAIGTAQVISDAVVTGESVSMHISGATPAITIGGTPALGDVIHFKVSRNVGGTDDHGYDVWLFGVLIQFTKGTTGVSAW